MTRLRLPLAAALAVAACAASPAPPAPPSPPTPEAARAYAERWRAWGDAFRTEMQVSMGSLFASHLGADRIVKGAPYSAQVVTEVRQPLPDGNRIVHATRGAVYRDGEGRTRQESEDRHGERSVFIHDVVAHKRYIVVPGMDTPVAVPDARHAPRSRHREVVRLDDASVVLEDGKAVVDGEPVPASEVRRTTSSGKVITVADGHILVDGRRADRGRGHGVTVRSVDREGPDGLVREEVRVRAMRAPQPPGAPVPPIPPEPPMPPVPPMPPGGLDAPLAPLPPMPGLSAPRFEIPRGFGPGVTTSLGRKDFGAVPADGRRTQWTIPAGAIGNEKPIVVTSESWFAPDLQVVVSSRFHDPRSGETLYRLEDIHRGEPPAQLFAAPKGE